MKITRSKLIRVFPFLFILNLFFCGKVDSQITSSLFMIRENFYAQMQNPSYMRSDDAITFAVPGLAGFSFGNIGNFKISDLVTLPSRGNPEIDLKHFYENGNEKNTIGQNFSIPLLYLNIPIKRGAISFFYEEKSFTFSKFHTDALRFLENGNVPENYRDFDTDDLNIFALGYRQFAFGYTRKINKRLDVGLRMKVLFGGLVADVENWSYGIKTSPDGDVVNLTANGPVGRLYSPVTLSLDNNNRIKGVKGKAFNRYLGAYENPGLALDLGASYTLDENNFVSIAIRDLGGIWFKNNAMNLFPYASYDFIGFDIQSATRYPHEQGYTNPTTSILLAKNRIRNVYKPIIDTTRFVKSLSPKMVLHYQYNYSEKISFGVTNQSMFQKNFFLNTLSVTAMQKVAKISFFENINLFGFESLAIGGGLQYEWHFGQVFVATDNLLGLYHPADNKTFSASFGVCFLVNNEKESRSKKSKKSFGEKGKISRYFPFYREKNK